MRRNAFSRFNGAPSKASPFVLALLALAGLPTAVRAQQSSEPPRPARPAERQTGGGVQALRLCDFETQADLKAWSFTAGTPKLVARGASHGSGALEIRFDPAGQYHPAYMTWNRPRRDWSGHDAMLLEVTNPGDQPMSGYVLIADQASADKNSSYWNRHNSSTTFPPGQSTWIIPVGGLYRGEAGSRNNDIRRNIDADSIVRLDLGFGNKGQTGVVIIDDLRLVKVSRPAGVWAFDFGPDDQSVMLGWTGVSNNSAYTKAAGFGWGPGGGKPWNGAARDTTFGPALLRDFCQAGGYRFRVDAPAGEYAVTILFENSGYWGGEQAMHSVRRVLVDGREVWSEKRPDGAAHALYRFEDVEPLGVDIWDTYMKAELARPVQFNVRAGTDGLTLHFESDYAWGAKIAGMIVHSADDKASAEWRDGQLDALAREFRRMAVCLDAPAGKFELPGAWKDRGVVAWPVALEDEITPHTLPPADAPAPDKLALTVLAARGETVALCLAVRAVTGQAPAGVRFAWDKTPARLPAELFRVWYNTRRGFDTIAYRIRPNTLRPCDKLPLEKDVTRQIILKLHIAADTPPGDYAGRLMLTVVGKELIIPVRLKVSPAVLDRQTDFRMGFFGLEPPDLLPPAARQEALEQTLVLLRECGMNTVCGGPDWTLTGWKDGQPVIDFARTDEFMALLAKHGFTGPVNGYGGLRFAGLHDGYEKGASAAKVARESGLDYEAAFMRAWKAVDQHAREKNWPVIWYALCDETRVREVAERELAFMRLMAKVSAAFPKTVRTSGSYSVHFRSRPSSQDDLLYWHQRFFEVLDISALNDHDESVMAEALRLGREVQIYNQGQDRYSFGLYQWSEFRKGVRARTQWHLNVLHGYQFFDLDGREPDTAMICYGRSGIYPTIAMERCRQGAQDFYLYQTLQRRIQAAREAGRKGPAIDSAAALLEGLDAGIGLNQRRPPAGYAPEALKAKVIAALEVLRSQE